MQQKLLVANRGEIALRIIRAARTLQIPTVAIYTPADATAPHVVLADQAVAIHPEDGDPASNSRGYLDAEHIVDICLANGVTLVHPGYGFLSENPQFAALIESKGITWLGPTSQTIEAMGLKHIARTIASTAGLPVVPGSQGLVHELNEAIGLADGIGFPVMLKSTAGGGGIGLVVCHNAGELTSKFSATQQRAKSLFHNDGLFLERYFPSARHIEIQIFGNGSGHVVHMGERECSVQRRYQKVIEETPSPFVSQFPELRVKMCDAAVRMCQSLNYASAGTVEFIVDDRTGEFFFLEMNTRLQVEHPVTEAAHPGLDLVVLMILQGIAQREGRGGLLVEDLDQNKYNADGASGVEGRHAIEARVYCENPSAGFRPSPGVLQEVSYPSGPGWEWLRVDGWVATGTTITPYFDPLLAKIVVVGPTREEAIGRLRMALEATRICGPPTNLAYLQAVTADEVWQAGKATTTFLNDFKFTPRAIDVLSGGIETTIQDFPGRKLGLGIPRSGPMDSLAHRAANILVGNPPGTETLEITLVGCRLLFHVAAVIAITGAPVKITLNGAPVSTWTRTYVPAGAKLSIGTIDQTGFRAYMAVRGGFPDVPAYLDSKSTSMGLGGYQGRALAAGDQLTLSPDCSLEPPVPERLLSLPGSFVPAYPSHWTIHCLPGPHCDEEFVTSVGIDAFFAATWTVSASANRMGIRLEGPKIAWARKNGGEGGSHPSNIHDNGYALGTVNLNGDTPVILTKEGPDMGGYLCMCTVATAELWKLGQLRPGNTIQFKRISFHDAIRLTESTDEYLAAISNATNSTVAASSFFSANLSECKRNPKLSVVNEDALTGRPQVVFRQAGDSAILIEYGPWKLDFSLRARIHAFERELQQRQVRGIWAMSPCIRSTMIHYDPLVVSQEDLLAALVAADAALPARMDDMTFPGRRITFPIVLDDRWCRAALDKYMRTIRDRAVYLPSNIEYLARNNGLDGGAEEALKLLVASDWLVFGVGFYLACPFLVPIDPRCRLVGQKMNPSRTYTPRGALGIAGLVAAIYPIASPGGYQLFGRTLPPWRTWGQTGKPWLLSPFDQLRFKIVSEEEYIELEKMFDAGRYVFETEPTTFSMTEYHAFVRSVEDEIASFKARQAAGTTQEELRESELLAQWEQRRTEQHASSQDRASPPQEGARDLLVGPGQIVIHAPTAGTVYRVCCQPGDVIADADTVLVVLEAMKTEVAVVAGDDAAGRRVSKLIQPGGSVRAGEAIVIIE